MDIGLVFNFHAEPVLKPFTFFDIGRKRSYFDNQTTEKQFHKTFKEKQEPLLKVIVQTAAEKDHKHSIYFSGSFLELALRFYPEILKSIRRQVAQGNIEIIAGTFQNSASCLISSELFKIEIERHSSLVKKLFGVRPACVLNSENIYSNKIAELISELKFNSAIAPAINWYIPENGKGQVLLSNGDEKLRLILTGCESNDSLANDLDTITSNSNGNGFKIVQIDPTKSSSKTNWSKVLGAKAGKNNLITVSDAAEQYSSKAIYNIPSTLALGPSELDLSFFIENPLQKEFLEKLKSIKSQINIKKDREVLNELMAIASTSNLLKICTKKNSSDITEPYDYYLQLMNILSDMEIRLFRNKV